jgi:tRNA (guanine-N7-)-methyltransferase
MPSKIWKNQYIELASTLPDALLCLSRKDTTPLEDSIICSKLSKFERRIIEIGSGSGGHLIERATRDPSALHIGIELRYKRAFRTAEKATQAGLGNVFVIRADVSQTLTPLEKFAIDGIYVNFPDPWARKRWHKHRILNEGFFVRISQMLRPDGFFSYKTDHREYFEETVELINQLNIFPILALSRNLCLSPELVPDNVQSEFELLFKSQNVPVHYLLAKKT